MGIECVSRSGTHIELRLVGWIGSPHDPESIWCRDLQPHLDAFSGEATIRLTSRGGSVPEALEISRMLRAVPGRIVTRVEVVAASSASLLAIAGDRVEIDSASHLMIHAPHRFVGGPADSAAISELEVWLGRMAAAYAARTGRCAVEERRRMLESGDRWMTARQAVADGYADAVVAPWWSRSLESEV